MEIARPVFSVLLVFVLLGAALWALRRGSPVSFSSGLPRGRWRQTGGRSRSLQSLERLVLSPQHSLYLIEVDDQKLLVAVHPQGCTLLREMAGGTRA